MPGGKLALVGFEFSNGSDANTEKIFETGAIGSQPFPSPEHSHIDCQKVKSRSSLKCFVARSLTHSTSGLRGQSCSINQRNRRFTGTRVRRSSHFFVSA